MLITPVLVPLLEVPTEPVQPTPVPPLAVHAVAPTVLQDSIADWPLCTVDGVALKRLTWAAGGGLATLTLMELGPLLPPGPLQFNVYV